MVGCPGSGGEFGFFITMPGFSRSRDMSRVAPCRKSKIDPLWRLDKTRLQDGKGTLSLTSSVTPPPSQEKIDQLVMKLMAISLTIEEVQQELSLEDWPPSYLAFQLRDRLGMVNGKWQDIDLARGGQQN